VLSKTKSGLKMCPLPDQVEADTPLKQSDEYMEIIMLSFLLEVVFNKYVGTN
jgi:hypothetical protein